MALDSLPETLRIAVVDNNHIVRAGLTAFLEEDRTLEITGGFGSGQDAIDALSRLAQPVDVAVLEYQLPDASSTALCGRLLAQGLARRVVFLACDPDEHVARACLAAGARGFLTKSVSGAELAEAIRVVARGWAVLSPDVTVQLIDWVRSADGDGDGLTADESALLRWVAQGLSNKQIGEKLFISESAVKLGLRRVMRKLGVRRRWEAVAAAADRGSL